MVVRELKHKIVYIMGLVSFGALFLAYQVRVPLELDLGARGDQAHISDFYDQEFADGLSHRWSSGLSTIHFRSVATQTPALLTLRLNGSRPGELPSPYAVIVANGREVGPLQTTDQFETYHLRLAPDILGVSGDLAIEIHCDAFVPAQVSGGGDRRQLGVMVDSIAVEPTPGRIPVVLPPLRQILCLVLTVMAAYLWARQLAVPTRRSLLIAGLLLAAMSALVIRWPLQLGLYDRWLATLLASVNVVTIVCRSAWSRLTGDRRVPAEAVLDLHLLLVFAVAIAAGLYVGKGIWQPLREDRATDFFINYTAATVLRQGGNIYDVAALAETSRTVDPDLVGWDFSGLFRMYITPPVNAILLLPLVPLGYERARIAFLLLSNLLLLSSLFIILKATRGDQLPRSHYLLAFVLLLTLDPIYVGLELGQVDLIMLFLIAVSFWAYKGGRNIIVGICLALATMIKLSPAILLIYVLWKRELSIIVSAVVTLLLSGILSWLVVGREAILLFGTNILPALLKGSAFFQNQSLNGFFSRLFVDSGLLYSLEECPDIPQARALTALASLMLVSVGALVTRKRISRKSLRSDLEFSLAIVIMLLVSSISWEHYFSWLMVPFLVLLNPESRTHLMPRKHLCVISAAFLAYLTTIVPSSLYGMTLHSSTVTYAAELGLTLLLSLRVYGALLLYSILAYLIAGLPDGDSREAAQWARAETRETSL